MSEQITVAIIGRGKSGTRIPAQLLVAGDAYIGKIVNASLDKTPFDKVYEAARLIGQHVEYLGNYEWDFSGLSTMPITTIIHDLITSYLEDVQGSRKQVRAWKLPETNLIYPILVRMFPDFHYIHWMRNPYSMLNKHHGADDLAEKYNVPMPTAHSIQELRAINWLYQWQIVHKISRPKRFLRVQYEEFMRGAEYETQRMERFLGTRLGRIALREPEPMPNNIQSFPFLDKALKEAGYVQTIMF